MATLTIDPNYGYVLLAATSSFVVNYIHSMNTSRMRKAAKIAYPAAYAPSSRTDKEANKFNCAQRAHANFIESQPTALAALLIAGLQFPLTAAGMGLGWSFGRYLYMTGYTRGEEGGKGRYQGIFFQIFQVGLIGMAAYNGAMMVMQK